MSQTSTQTANPRFFAAFHAHPASVGESYFGHMRFALGFSARLFAAAFCALVHALIPPLFETTASRQVKALAALCSHRSGDMH